MLLRSNAFTAKLAGAGAVTLDTTGMHLRAASPIDGAVNTDRATMLILRGRFPRGVRVIVDGRRVPVRSGDGALRIPVPAGDHRIRTVTNRN